MQTREGLVYARIKGYTHLFVRVFHQNMLVFVILCVADLEGVVGDSVISQIPSKVAWRWLYCENRIF